MNVYLIMFIRWCVILQAADHLNFVGVLGGWVPLERSAEFDEVPLGVAGKLVGFA